MRTFLTAMFLCCAVSMASAAQKFPEYQLTPTPGWQDKSHLSADLLRQIFGPGQNALLEIYYAKGHLSNLNIFADQWEAGARKRGVPYVKKRTGTEKISFRNNTVPGLERQYTGDYEGVKLESSVRFLAYKGFMMIVVGVYVSGQKQYSAPVKAMMKSFYPGPEIRTVKIPAAPPAHTDFSPDNLIRQYYALLQKEDLTGLKKIITAPPGRTVQDEIKNYQFTFRAVDQKINAVSVKETRFSSDKKGCIAEVDISGDVIQADGKKRFTVSEPFMVCMRKTKREGWRIEQVIRKSAFQLTRMSLKARGATEKLMGGQ